MTEQATGSTQPGNVVQPIMLTKAQAAQNIVNMLHDVAERVADGDDHDALITILRALQQKPGVRTTEFWLSMLMNAVGFAFQFWSGHEVIGATMMVAATSIYTLSRMVVKKAEAAAPAQVPVKQG